MPQSLIAITSITLKFSYRSSLNPDALMLSGFSILPALRGLRGPRWKKLPRSHTSVDSKCCLVGEIWWRFKFAGLTVDYLNRSTWGRFSNLYFIKPSRWFLMQTWSLITVNLLMCKFLPFNLNSSDDLCLDYFCLSYIL